MYKTMKALRLVAGVGVVLASMLGLLAVACGANGSIDGMDKVEFGQDQTKFTITFPDHWDKWVKGGSENDIDLGNAEEWFFYAIDNIYAYETPPSNPTGIDVPNLTARMEIVPSNTELNEAFLEALVSKRLGDLEVGPLGYRSTTITGKPAQMIDWTHTDSRGVYFLEQVHILEGEQLWTIGCFGKDRNSSNFQKCEDALTSLTIK